MKEKLMKNGKQNKQQRWQHSRSQKGKIDLFLSDSVIILQLSEGGQNKKFSVTSIGVTQNYTLGLANVNKTLELEISNYSCRH